MGKRMFCSDSTHLFRLLSFYPLALFVAMLCTKNQQVLTPGRSINYFSKDRKIICGSHRLFMYSKSHSDLSTS